MVEVLVAALLVGVIAVGTFSAFSAASHGTADARAHSEAIQLAGQDEERVRSLTASTLDNLSSESTSRAENGDCLEGVAGKWKYWNTTNTSFCEKATGLAGTAYTGVVFTVKTSAQYVSAETGGTKSSLTCETSGGAASYLQTTSSVTWPSLGTRPAVKQTSLLNIPSSAALVVKVVNQKNEGVEGATIKVSGVTPELTSSTPATGCVIFGALSPGSIKVTATKAGWINEGSEASPTATALTITAKSTTEHKFTIAEPGSIEAEFINAASPHEAVKGSTFYAFQTTVPTPDGFVGGTYSGVVTTAASASTKAGFTERFLFPFRNTGEKPPGVAPYTVFAGDCEKNNAKTVTGSAVDPTAQVEPGATTSVKVEMPKVSVKVYEGTTGSTVLPSAFKAMIINKGCETEKMHLSGGSSASVPYEHEVEVENGELKQAFQPFAAELEFCVVQKKSATKYFKYKGKFENKTAAGVNLGSIYMEAVTAGHEKSEKELKCP